MPLVPNYLSHKIYEHLLKFANETVTLEKLSVRFEPSASGQSRGKKIRTECRIITILQLLRRMRTVQVS